MLAVILLMPHAVLWRWLFLCLCLLALTAYYVWHSGKLGQQLARWGIAASDDHAGLLVHLQRRSLMLLALATTLVLLVVCVDILHHAPGIMAPRPQRVAAVPPPAARPLPQLPPAPSASHPVLAIFGDYPMFSEEESAKQSHIDRLKFWYEQLVVTYKMLQRCELAEAEHLTRLQAALINDLERLGEAPGLEQAIWQAAGGSYAELYERTPCASVAPMREGFLATLTWLETRRK